MQLPPQHVTLGPSSQPRAYRGQKSEKSMSILAPLSFSNFSRCCGVSVSRAFLKTFPRASAVFSLRCSAVRSCPCECLTRRLADLGRQGFQHLALLRGTAQALDDLGLAESVDAQHLEANLFQPLALCRCEDRDRLLLASAGFSPSSSPRAPSFCSSSSVICRSLRTSSLRSRSSPASPGVPKAKSPFGLPRFGGVAPIAPPTKWQPGCRRQHTTRTIRDRFITGSLCNRDSEHGSVKPSRGPC